MTIPAEIVEPNVIVLVPIVATLILFPLLRRVSPTSSAEGGTRETVRTPTLAFVVAVPVIPKLVRV